MAIQRYKPEQIADNACLNLLPTISRLLQSFLAFAIGGISLSSYLVSS